ncbi:MAG: hypothetical protein O8C61_11070 [Candidatus Methanoperedens sp.]|nr:hypothetical protein [Candidatus Methanoperedens sp.]
MRDDKNKEKKNGFFDYYKVTVSLIRVVIWPLIVLYFFLSLQAPLTATIEQVPNILSKTSYITISGVTLEINQRLSDEASPELKLALSELSPEALKEFVNTGQGDHMTKTSYLGFSTEKAKLEELDKKGLINLTISEPDKEGYDVHYKATELGLKAYDFILKVIIDQMLHAPPSTRH